jgi:hypothetical protein
VKQIKHDRFDGVNVLAAEKSHVEGRHSDQSYRHNADHVPIIGVVYLEMSYVEKHG